MKLHPSKIDRSQPFYMIRVESLKEGNELKTHIVRLSNLFANSKPIVDTDSEMKGILTKKAIKPITAEEITVTELDYSERFILPKPVMKAIHTYTDTAQPLKVEVMVSNCKYGVFFPAKYGNIVDRATRELKTLSHLLAPITIEAVLEDTAAAAKSYANGDNTRKRAIKHHLDRIKELIKKS
jgi:hypothetical protein